MPGLAEDGLSAFLGVARDKASQNQRDKRH